MQVEYASSASMHSSPLLAVPLFLDEKCIGIVMATLLAGGRKGGGGGGRRGQSRIVEIPIGPPPTAFVKQGSSSSSGNYNRGSVVVGLSGVLSDNVALLEHAREDTLESWHRSYGLHCLHHQSPITTATDDSSSSSSCLSMAGLATSTARRIVTSIGDKCQTHSFGGGLRPYGARILVCGVDGCNGLVMGIADPSGAVSIFSGGGGKKKSSVMIQKKGEEDSEKAAKEEEEETNKKSRYSMDAMVIGGDTKVQSLLRREVRKRLLDSLHGLPSTPSSSNDNNDNDEEKLAMRMIREAIESTIVTLVEEDKSSNPLDSFAEKDNNNVLEEKMEQNGNKTEEKNQSSLLEVVVVTPNNGVHRLSEEQIEKFRRRASSSEAA